MKFRKVADGYEIQVGDLIVADNGVLGKTKHLVTRVTPKYSFVKWNEVVEGKFPRKYNGFFFLFIPYSQMANDKLYRLHSKRRINFILNTKPNEN